MSNELGILTLTALSIGFLHTMLGPDHYIPFIAMAKAGKWSISKTIMVTIFSGIGHVLGSILLGLFGIAIGVALNLVEEIESFRESLAGWALISFGLIYLIWGIRQAARNKKHIHFHKHEDGHPHIHLHNHSKDHVHVHEEEKAANITPWILFTIFIFGPCEALVPILIYPAANIGLWGLAIVILVFALTTILTMLAIVILSIYGINFLPLGKFERYAHVFAGGIIVLSGISIQFLAL